MGNQSFFLGTDAELYTASQAFSDKIVTGFAVYGLTTAQAEAYSTLNDNYAGAYNAAKDPLTRTKAKTAAKNNARKALVTMASDLAKIIAGKPVTDEQKIELGLNVRKTPSEQQPPTSAPVMEVEKRIGTIVSIRLHDADVTNKRARPATAAGASVFTFVGAQPPVNVNDWTFWGNISKTTASIQFDVSLAPGTVVWLTSFWYTRRGETSPGTTPMSAILAGGGVENVA